MDNTESHESKLQTFEIMWLRKVEGVTRMDRVRNKQVRKALGLEEVLHICSEGKANEL